MDKRIIAIGDVHGCLEETKRLLDVVEYDGGGDRLIFLGDLVDRGPESAACVKFVRNLGVECVLGNHDDKYARYHGHVRKNHNSGGTYRIPMKMSDNKLAIYNGMDIDDLDWLQRLPRFLHVEEINTVFMHAGVAVGQHPLHQRDDAYLYCRYVDAERKKMVTLNKDFTQPEGSTFWTEHYMHPINIVFGHHVVSLDEPEVTTNPAGAKMIGIDTGSCFGGRLTAYIHDGTNESFEQVSVETTYYEPSVRF